MPLPLQAILKRGLQPSCTIIPLMKKDHRDNLEFFLSNVGQLYLTGCGRSPCSTWEAPQQPGHRAALRWSPGSGPLGAGPPPPPRHAPLPPCLGHLRGPRGDGLTVGQRGWGWAVTAPLSHPPALTSTPTGCSHPWSSRLPGAPPSSPPTSSGTTARPGMCPPLRISPTAPAAPLPLSIRLVSPCDAGGQGGRVASPSSEVALRPRPHRHQPRVP